MICAQAADPDAAPTAAGMLAVYTCGSPALPAVAAASSPAAVNIAVIAAPQGQLVAAGQAVDA